MQQTSEKYKDLQRRGGHYEFIVTIGSVTYGRAELYELKTTKTLFDGNGPSVGGCVAGEIDLKMRIPDAEIPRMARIRPYVRLVLGEEKSELLQKGEFFIDTRSIDRNGGTITIHGYDAMLKAETDFDAGGLVTGWPRKDIDVINMVAKAMGVRVDTRTAAVIKNGYDIELPTGYSNREVLSNIAALYAGNFAISDTGELLLVCLGDENESGNGYLVTEWGAGIAMGGVLIRV